MSHAGRAKEGQPVSFHTRLDSVGCPKLIEKTFKVGQIAGGINIRVERIVVYRASRATRGRTLPDRDLLSYAEPQYLKKKLFPIRIPAVCRDDAPAEDAAPPA
jgi:hypothetical protein